MKTKKVLVNLKLKLLKAFGLIKKSSFGKKIKNFFKFNWQKNTIEMYRKTQLEMKQNSQSKKVKLYNGKTWIQKNKQL